MAFSASISCHVLWVTRQPLNAASKSGFGLQLIGIILQVALVTGGCGWLGSAFCQALAEMGATVCVSARA